MLTTKRGYVSNCSVFYLRPYFVCADAWIEGCGKTAQWRSQNAEENMHIRSRSDSLQLRPFSKWELLLEERICSQRERIYFFKNSTLWYGKSL